MTEEAKTPAPAASPASDAAIGFPAPLLGSDNFRLRVLYNANGLLALDRPANILCGPHPWHNNLPILCEALNGQLAAGKPELLRLGLDPAKPAEPIFHVDPGIAGIAILALGPEAAAHARNAFGSTQWKLRFELISVGGPEEDEAVCEKPVARHNNLPMALVSTTTGKKTSTAFHRLERLGRYSLWEATTNYYRADQLPVHATELGISITGEDFYAREQAIYMSRVKQHKWTGDIEAEQPMYDAPTAWLAELTLDDGTVIKADPPRRVVNILKQLRKYCVR
jgi:23S rRNA-/tRNA-specific pseudouridylate synthase